MKMLHDKMKFRKKAGSLLSIFLCILIVCTACGRAGYPEYVLNTESTLQGTEKQQSKEEQQGSDKQYNDTVQLTEADIQEMNDGKAIIVYNDQNYVSTLIGKYYGGKIETYEDAVASLNGVASLIGLSNGSEFFCVYGEEDNAGYIYYTFQQKYGGLTLQYATLKVIIDPNGYTAGLTCSFTPNVGIAEEKTFISEAEAESIVKKRFPENVYQYYTDCTQKSAVTYNNLAVECMVVYTSNPDQSMSFDMPYIEHFVSYAGEYLTSVPTSSIGSEITDAYKTSDYFKNLQPATCTATVTLYDGTTKEITVPTAYNEQDNLYYLADIDRKIMVADYAAFNYQDGKLDFITSADNQGWDNNYLITYYNYILAYDYYADMNIKSVDGFETPILITVNMCYENGEPDDNAYYYGINNGWACFGSSQVNCYGEGLDIVAHEFTHGITRNAMMGTKYANETGAINEAYSDIMGNIIEMSFNETTDQSWLVGENTGTTLRSMSDPNAFQQPAYVGDLYYGSNVLTAHQFNDNGSVHTNNSLLSHIAYQLNASGMSLSDQSKLWFTSIELLTPLADYDDVHACLLFSAKINGLEQYSDTITGLFLNAGLLGNREESAYTSSKAGCGRLEFNVSEELATGIDFVEVYTVNLDGSGNYQFAVCPDVNGRISVLLPAGQYMFVYNHVTDEGILSYGFQQSGWVSGRNNLMIIDIVEGNTSQLSDVY